MFSRTRTTLVPVALVLAFLACTVQPALGVDATEILDKMTAKLEGCEDFSATMTGKYIPGAVMAEEQAVQAEQLGQPKEFNYTSKTKSKKPEKFAMETVVEMVFHDGRSMEIKNTTISDGETVWIIVTRGGQPKVMRGSVETMKRRGTIPMGKMGSDAMREKLEKLRKTVKFVLEAEEAIGGIDCYRFSGTLKVEDLASFTGQKGVDLDPFMAKTINLAVAVGKEDLLPRKIDIALGNKAFMGFVFSDVKLNSGIPDSAFTYTPPKGVTVGEVGAVLGADFAGLENLETTEDQQ